MSLIVCSCVLLAFAPDPIDIPSSQFGPYGNKEDQYRYFWSGPWQEFVDAGFNMPAEFLGRDSDFANRKLVHPDLPAERQKRIDRSRAAGIGYAERMAVVCDAYLSRQWPIVNRDGSRTPPYPDATNPECYEAMLEMTRKAAATIPDDPVVSVVHVNSEVRDNARPSFTPELKRLYAKASGGREVPPEVQNRQAPHFRQIKGFPVSRIVPEDDPLLSFFRWYWYDGDRWNSYSTDATRIYQDRQYPMATMYDPIVRNPPIRGCGGKVTFGSQWVYVVPEPYNCSFSISEEQAMVKGHPGQGVWAMIQAITYRRECAPGAPPEGATAPAWYGKYPDCRYVSTPSDFMREAMWCLFSRQIDGHCHYAYQALIPQPDPIDKKTGKSTRTPYTYVCTDTNTYYVISELFHRIGEPLGPLLRAAPERPPQVAVLESFATYAFAHKASMSSTCQPIFDRGSIAVVASLQPYVLYEEDLAEKGIPDSVKVLLAPHCDVLAQKSFEAIRAWQLRGGVLIADANLPPALMRDYDYPAFARTGKAATDAPAVRKAAAELRALVLKACVPYAGTSTDDIFTWVRSSGSADYVFAINDRRVAGDYVGQWGVIHEKGLPTSGAVTIERLSGAVYDLERHCAVPFTSEGGRTTVRVDLRPCDGAVLMATAAPLKPLKVIESETSVGCVVTVYAPEKDAMIPIEVTADGLKKPFYGVIKGGNWTHDFAGVKGGFRIRNLADGSVREAEE